MDSFEFPLVSVIIPAYNAEQFISETLDSILQQSYPNIEIIVINDGSNDKTNEIVLGYTSLHNNIRLISKKNEGVSVARNTGIELAKGEFLAFCDADDLWKEFNLEEKIKTLKSSNSDFIFSNMDCCNEKGEFLGEAEKGRSGDLFKKILLWEGEVIPAPCSNLVMHCRCAEKIRFNPILSTAADQFFTLEITRNFNGYYLNKITFTYRVHTNSMSRNISLMEKDHILVYKIAKSNKWIDGFWFTNRCFSNLYLILAGSWWVNGNSKIRGFGYLILSIVHYPPNIFKLLKKKF